MQRHTPPYPTRPRRRPRPNATLADLDGTLALLAILALVVNQSPSSR